MDLYERLHKQLHGVIEIENISGEKQPMLLMDVWVKSVRENGHIAAWQILAIVLHVLGSDPKKVSVDAARKLVYAWEKVLRQRISPRNIPRISPRHPLTLLPLGELPKDLEWVIPIKQADHFLNGVGMDFSVSEFLEFRYNHAHVNRYGEKTTPETGQIPHSTTQESIPAPLNRWPWGNHHTEALGHLEAAALRFWVNHDPTEPSTAPTNKEVVAWLQTERKVSKTLAEAMASILRLDGLPTGPRK